MSGLTFFFEVAGAGERMLVFLTVSFTMCWMPKIVLKCVQLVYSIREVVSCRPIVGM